MSSLTLTFKGKTLKVYQLSKGESFIGSDPTCELHIDSLAVQPRHASVMTTGSTSIIHDLGSPDGISVNGKKVTEHTLKNEDSVQIGKHELLFEQSEDEEKSSEEEQENFTVSRQVKKTAWLQILNGHNVGKTISLSRNITNLGKPGVQTAVISKRSGGYFITHLEGVKPTTVDDQNIGDRSWPLDDGNIIQIGNVKMQFSLD